MAKKIPAWAHYRESSQPGVACSTCDFYDGDKRICEYFDGAPVEPDMVCDEWEHRVDKGDGYTPLASTPGVYDPKEIPALGELIAALEPVYKDATEGLTPQEFKITPGAKAYLNGFWAQYPNLRDGCKTKYGYDPVQQHRAYWRWGLSEPEHKDVLHEVMQNGGVFNAELAQKWAQEEVHEANISKDDGYKPTSSMKSAAARALKWHEEGHRGGTNIGLGRAHQIVNGENLSASTVKRMHSFFSRHAVDKNATGFNSGEKGFPSPGRVAWDLWGGDAGASWAKATAERIDRSSHVSKAEGCLYLISHACTRYNNPGKPHDVVHGWKDIPLNTKGRDQAKELGELLKNKNVDELYSSNLKRASQTAHIISNIIGVPDKSQTAFRPWNLGEFAGHSSHDVIPKLKPYMTTKKNQSVNGGESFNDFENRFIPALENLLKKAEAGKTIVLVTHSRNLEFAQGWLSGSAHRKKVDIDAISEDKIDPATVIKITRNAKTGKWMQNEEADESVAKGDARPAEIVLRVAGVSRTPSGARVYRTETRDGHYVGRTLPSRARARKGDVIKVQANDFLQDANGDLRWQNPNVVGAQIKDTPHSWRELCAMAGGELAKDGAEGAGGDIPPAGDEGIITRMPSGPTLDAVHIPAPLPNISVAYANRKLIPSPERATFQVAKAEPWKQLVYGVVLEPNSLDSQNDYMLPKAVEKAAHAYLKKSIRGKASVMKLQHKAQGFRKEKPSIVPVESFIAPIDFSYDGKEMIKAGSWVMVVHVEDENLWQGFLNGTYNAFSVGGTGVRKKLQATPEYVPHGYISQEPSDWKPQPSSLRIGDFI